VAAEEKEARLELKKQQDLANGLSKPVKKIKKKALQKGSNNSVAGAFTSSAMTVNTTQQALVYSETELLKMRYEQLRKAKPPKKAYVTLHTSMGDLNFILHCSSAPITCHNFILLCEDGYA